MIIDLASAVITGVMSGGATGLIGVALQQWGEGRKRAHDLEILRINSANALAQRQLDIDSQIKLAGMAQSSAERLAEIQAEQRAGEAASADYQASMSADRATYSLPAAQQQSRAVRWMMGLVDFLRGIIRPGVTLYSMALQTMLLAWVHEMWISRALAVTPDLQTRLVMEIVGTTTYLVTTTTVWWFGVRPAVRK